MVTHIARGLGQMDGVVSKTGPTNDDLGFNGRRNRSSPQNVRLDRRIRLAIANPLYVIECKALRVRIRDCSVSSCSWFDSGRLLIQSVF